MSENIVTAINTALKAAVDALISVLLNVNSCDNDKIRAANTLLRIIHFIDGKNREE